MSWERHTCVCLSHCCPFSLPACLLCDPWPWICGHKPPIPAATMGTLASFAQCWIFLNIHLLHSSFCWNLSLFLVLVQRFVQPLPPDEQAHKLPTEWPLTDLPSTALCGNPASLQTSCPPWISRGITKAGPLSVSLLQSSEVYDAAHNLHLPRFFTHWKEGLCMRQLAHITRLLRYFPSGRPLRVQWQL